MSFLNKISDWAVDYSKVILNSRKSERDEINKDDPETELISTISEYRDNKDITDLEAEMILNVLTLDDTLASEILAPKPDVEYISPDTELSDIIDYVSDKPYTRYPVVDKKNDVIDGFVDSKDLILELQKDRKSDVLAKDISRDIPVYPETIGCDRLLVSLQEDGSQVAAIIDEWGSFEGIVTVEDIVEIVVGEIRDQFDNIDNEPTVLNKGGTYEVDGDVPLHKIERIVDTDFNVERSDTVAGFLLSETGELPDVGETIVVDDMEFEVLELDNKRIVKVGIRSSKSSE